MSDDDTSVDDATSVVPAEQFRESIVGFQRLMLDQLKRNCALGVNSKKSCCENPSDRERAKIGRFSVKLAGSAQMRESTP